MFASRGIRRGAREPLDFTVMGTYTSGSIGSSPHTISSQSIGVANTKRIVIVSLASTAALNILEITAVTIGGVTATVVASSPGGTAIAYARVPTGTTADIVVTIPSGAATLSAQVYRLVRTNIVHLDSGVISSLVASPQTIDNIACRPDGVVVLLSGAFSSYTTVNAWNGTDTLVNDYNPDWKLTASHIVTTENSGIRDVTITQGVSSAISAIVVSWR